MKRFMTTLILIGVFVFSFALSFQLSTAGSGDPKPGECCYKPCAGIGLGDYGHYDQALNCDCRDFNDCRHECNTCAQ